LRETEKYLVLNIEGVTSMKEAKEQLENIGAFVFGKEEATA
jgi:hypothetical protein